MYHQDLAYYQHQGQATSSQPAGTQDRVMEWMLEVERQQRDTQDNKSQSSKGANKTSPSRSGRLKSSGGMHRSMSQERGGALPSLQPPGQAQLSQSWSQHQRLQPSNNSTLRKQSQQPNTKPLPTELTVAVYTFSHEKGEPMPYRIKIPSKAVTLKQVKEFLPKKGAFRFYFKTEVEGCMCYEEETEDSALVPTWEGKVLVQCRLRD